jgi:hypothetical protein
MLTCVNPLQKNRCNNWGAGECNERPIIIIIIIIIIITTGRETEGLLYIF